MFRPKILHEFGRFQIFARMFLPKFLQEFGQFWNFVQTFVPNFLRFFRELFEAFLGFLICLALIVSTKPWYTFVAIVQKLGAAKGIRQMEGRAKEGMVMAWLWGFHWAQKPPAPLPNLHFRHFWPFLPPPGGHLRDFRGDFRPFVGRTPGRKTWQPPFGVFLGGSFGRPNFLGILWTTPGGRETG